MVYNSTDSVTVSGSFLCNAECLISEWRSVRAEVSPPPIVLQPNKPPAKLNLLTCQVKRNPDEKKSFDLFSRMLQTSCSHVSSVCMCVKSKLCLVPPPTPPHPTHTQMTGPTTSRPRMRPSVRCKYEPAWPKLPGFALLRALMVWCFSAGCRCCRTVRRRRWTRRSKETRTRVRTTSSRSWPSPSWERWRRELETTAAATVELQVRIIQKSLSNKHHSSKETKFKD